MNREQTLRQRIRGLTWIVILGLVASGATAMPLRWEAKALAQWLGAGEGGARDSAPPQAGWLTNVRDALAAVEQRYPFLYYGTDWLAFGHFVIAIAFIGALRDPVRNRWLFDFGLLACGLVIPFALVMGGLRGIPLWWRCVDCSFGVLGFIPLWFCRTWSRELDGA